ncbi:MAG TPA: DUF4340 domain-containing protein [Tepidisphaeraceae bacterium]|nr:DUF4340 domain-containing protein [Tepidisphaeraceae bacterium]
MNFRTTFILLILLLGVGAYVMFTSKGSSSGTLQTTNATRVVDVSSSDVTKITISPNGGTPIVLERSTQAGGTPPIGPAVSDWKMTSPEAVYADQMKVSDLLDGITTATSTAQVPISGNAADYGLDTPQYTIELDAGMKTFTLEIGRTEQAGNELFVRLSGSDTAEVIGADLLDRLNDATVDKLRLARLVNADSTAVNWINVARQADPFTLEKVAGNWQMSLPTKPPTTEPVEQSSADDLISSISNAQAVQFADADADASRLIGTPLATVTVSSEAPSTQPTAATETIEFGLPDSLLAKNVWVRVTPPGVLATISKDTADSILKTPLDLRSRDVVRFDPADVETIRIAKATPPTTRPVAIPELFHQIVLARRPPKPAEKAGPPLPAAHPATTRPSSVWQLVQNRVPADADDSKVDTLLSNFNPLRADKFVATAPSSAGQTTYVVTITPKTGEPVTILFSDPGESSDSINGACGKLNFTLSRSIVTSLDSDFAKTSTP